MITLWGVPVFQETSNLTLSNFTSKEYNFLEKLEKRYPGGSFDVHYSENRVEGDL